MKIKQYECKEDGKAALRRATKNVKPPTFGILVFTRLSSVANNRPVSMTCAFSVTARHNIVHRAPGHFLRMGYLCWREPSGERLEVLEPLLTENPGVSKARSLSSDDFSAKNCERSGF